VSARFGAETAPTDDPVAALVALGVVENPNGDQSLTP
jgi:hypothetical protein